MILNVEGLNLFYGDAQALDDVSLEVDAGDIVAVVGSNGAGKSSLIRTIAGMQKPRSGRIVYKDVDIAGWPRPPGLQSRHRPGRRRPPDIRRAHGAREP